MFMAVAFILGSIIGATLYALGQTIYTVIREELKCREDILMDKIDERIRNALIQHKVAHH